MTDQLQREESSDVEQQSARLEHLQTVTKAVKDEADAFTQKNAHVCAVIDKFIMGRW